MSAQVDGTKDAATVHSVWAGPIFAFGFAEEGTDARSPTEGFAGGPGRFAGAVGGFFALSGAIGPLDSGWTEEIPTTARTATTGISELAACACAATQIG